MRSALLAVALAAALAGCGSSHATPVSQSVTSVPPPTTTATAPTATEQATTAQTATLSTAPATLTVFFLRNGKVAPVTRDAPAAPAVGATALRLLAGGPTAAERADGLTSAVAAGSAFTLTIHDGTAVVTGPEGLSDAAAAQIVYTLTQFPAVQIVRLNGGNAGGRAEWERMTPPILVLTPTPGQTVHSPLRVAGTANTFEATLELELQDSGGGVLAHEVVTATSGTGTRGTFAAELPYTSSGGAGKLVAFETSAKDGSRIHVVEIPVVLGAAP